MDLNEERKKERKRSRENYNEKFRRIADKNFLVLLEMKN